MPPLAAYAGSQGMGTPDLTKRLNLIHISQGLNATAATP